PAPSRMQAFRECWSFGIGCGQRSGVKITTHSEYTTRAPDPAACTREAQAGKHFARVTLYGVRMTATHERRITDLESASYRLSRPKDGTDSPHAEALQHLTSAGGGLSQGQPGLPVRLGEGRRRPGRGRRG